jgi:beta-phosphoglucomutase-like phosphatase (HAD superfamily)
MIYQAVIFDFDGVIVDSEILSNALLAEALTEIGHPTSLEQALERYIGLSWRDTIAIIEDEIGRPLPGEFRPRMRKAFELRLDEVTVVAGVEAFLDSLPPLPKAVASSSSSQWLRSSLERFGLAHISTGICSAPPSKSSAASLIPTSLCMRRASSVWRRERCSSWKTRRRG